MRKSKLLKYAGRLLIVAIVGWLCSSALVAWKLTRRGEAPFAEQPPKTAWADFESCRLTTSDGQSIGGWFIDREDAKGCVLVLHGRGDSRGSMLDVAKLAFDNGHAVLAISMRCHGDSSGEVDDFGWSARHDVIAAVDFLQERRPAKPIYVVGQSMGAAAAIFAAEQLDDRVAGYFLEQPYMDLDSATFNRLQMQLPIGLDWVAYAGLRLFSPLFLPVDFQQISPCERAADIPQSVPVVIATGSADRRARLSEVKAIYQKVRSHAELEVFDGAVHQSLYGYDPDKYVRTMTDFLGRTTQ